MTGVGSLSVDLGEKMHPLCYKWPSLCWGLLKAQSALLFLNEHSVTILLMPLLIFLTAYLIHFIIECHSRTLEEDLRRENEYLIHYLENLRKVVENLKEIAKYREMHGGKNNSSQQTEEEPVQGEIEQGAVSPPPPSSPPTQTPLPEQPEQENLEPEKSVPETVGSSNGTSGDGAPPPPSSPPTQTPLPEQPGQENLELGKSVPETIGTSNGTNGDGDGDGLPNVKTPEGSSTQTTPTTQTNH